MKSHAHDAIGAIQEAHDGEAVDVLKLATGQEAGKWLQGDADDPALFLADPGGGLDVAPVLRLETDRDLVYHARREHVLDVVDRPDDGTGHFRLGVARSEQVTQHVQSQLALLFDPVGELLGVRAGADDEHLALHAALLPKPPQKRAQGDARGDRHDWLHHEQHCQQQAADAGQVEDEQAGERHECEHDAGADDLEQLATQRPVRAQPVEPDEPQGPHPQQGVGSRRARLGQRAPRPTFLRGRRGEC